jgi:hypothetical protein
MNEAKLGSYSVYCVSGDVWMCCARVSYKLLCSCLLELYRHNWHGAVQISFHNVEGKYVRYMESPCHCFGLFLWCNIIHHWQNHTGTSNLLSISFRHVWIQIFNFWNRREDRVSRNERQYRKELKNSDFFSKIMINSYQIQFKMWEHIWARDCICSNTPPSA